MQSQTNYTGIDISKSFFDLVISNGTRYSYYKFSNDQAGFRLLLKALPEQSCVVMEASSPYYLRLASFLSLQSIAVSVINPLVIRWFAQMRMSRIKTDKKDAVMIAEYGKTEKPSFWQVPQQHVITMQQMEAILDQLNKEQTVLRNQLGSFESSRMLETDLQAWLAGEVRHRNEKIQQLTAQMEQLAETHYGEMLNAVTSVPGIGKKTAMALIVLSGGFQRFENAKQLSAYIDICPRIYESGERIRGKARICKMGMSRIRALLYVCAWSASRCNKTCRELYCWQKEKPRNRR